MRGTTIASLELSPDGKTLFVAFSTGGGPNYQPGGVLALNVNLYIDGRTDVPGLQSDLTSYLRPAFANQFAFAMNGAGRVSGGDEPSGMAVSKDGKYLYLLNGGMTSFTAIAPEQLQPAEFTDLIGGPGFGINATIGYTSGIDGITSAVNSSGNSSSALNQKLKEDLVNLAKTGMVILTAPGFTGVFDVSPSNLLAGNQRWFFPPDVVTGWNPPANRGGLIVNQFSFSDVYASRPFGLAMRPDGRRAIAAFYQTGNFGVLDLDLQEKFTGPPPTSPVFPTLQKDFFQAFVG